MINALGIFLIVSGSFLEVYFYAYRFTSDGLNLLLAITIGAALDAMLVAFTIKRKFLGAWLVAIPLFLYSVFATSAGQRVSLGLVLEEHAEDMAEQENTRDAIEEYRRNIERLDRESEQLLDTTEGLTLRERANFRTYGILPIEERKIAIAEEREMWQERIDEERERLTTHADIEQEELNIYTFYSGLIGVDERGIQVALQILLSVFIALMAPTGIIMLQARAKKKRKPRNKPVKKKEPEKIVDPEYAAQAEEWARISYYGIESNQRDRLLDIETVKRFALKHGKKNNLYEKILDDSLRYGIIKKRDDGMFRPTVGRKEAVKILIGEA